MTYRITGLDPQIFAPFWGMEPDRLEAHRASLRLAEVDGIYPCRVSLDSASKGERLLLCHYVHHEVETPYRSAFAIFVREGASQAVFVDRCPPVFAARPLALRAYSSDGCLVDARLAAGDDADAAIRSIFELPQIAYIDAHNAAHGCFAARVHRDGD